MEAANLTIFFTFENVNKLDILCYLCKKIVSGNETGGKVEQTWGAAPLPRPGLKPPLAVTDKCKTITKCACM